MCELSNDFNLVININKNSNEDLTVSKQDQNKLNRSLKATKACKIEVYAKKNLD